MQLLRMRESIRTVWGNCKLLKNKVYAHVTILSLKKKYKHTCTHLQAKWVHAFKNI